jgi:alpha-tubulin suppressor-like RCC1 family protein
LALKSDGTVAGWGDGTDGQIYPPLDLTNAVAVMAGANHSLALRADGTVAAWGGNNYGQANVPGGLTTAVAIAAGQWHSLALRADGTVLAWGINAGNGDGQYYGQTAVPSGLANVNWIAAGSYHSLALSSTGLPIQHVTISATRGFNSFSVSVQTQNGRVYASEYKTSLTNSAWTALPLVAGNGAVRTVIDPNATSFQRFYRVRRW